MLERRASHRVAACRCGGHLPHSRQATTQRSPGQLEEAFLAALGLPAAVRPAVAGQPARVDDGVPDLAGVAGAAAERETAGDDAGADAGVPREVDGVVDAGGGAAHVLGPDAEVGVVADRHGQARAPAASSAPTGASFHPRFGA